MAMGKRKPQEQENLWVATSVLSKAPGHPFYERLNAVLGQNGFEPFVEGLCAKYYHETQGRPGIPPGVYFRMLFVGYFEGLDSEREIAWRAEDSLGLRRFLGIELEKPTPDHSSISRTRRMMEIETHQEVFDWVLKLLGREGVLKGKTLGIDATTLEANAAMRSIVRRDTGESYQDFLKGLAKASGIETPTRADLAKLDRKRPHKGSNDDWEHPGDPDAKIGKMKDGSTHLLHKAEHAVDMEGGAVVAVGLGDGNEGDTTSLPWTLMAAQLNLKKVAEDAEAGKKLSEDLAGEVVADKGYHSNDMMAYLQEERVRSYVSEPDRGNRHWVGKSLEKLAVYANRRRIEGKRGRELMRLRGELLERSFAHCYETGGLRRLHLRERGNILKRLLVHVAGFNIGLLMRTRFGQGTPRGMRDALADLLNAGLGRVFAFLRALAAWDGIPCQPSLVGATPVPA
jgi:transposase